MNEYRTLRERQTAFLALLDRKAPAQEGTARIALQIFDGGHMPTATDHYFLGHPVDFGGAETEGGNPAQSVNTAASVPFDVLGTTVPAVGDILIATGVGGRWVAERGKGQPPDNCCVTLCAPCAIPRKDLVLSWTNILAGNGSAPFPFNGGAWVSACISGLLFTLQCSGDQTLFSAIYFTTGACPTGTRQQCTSLGAAPFKLTLTDSQCNPFRLTYAVTSSACPTVTSAGFIQLVVSDPSPVTIPPGLMCATAQVLYCDGTGVTGATVSIFQGQGGPLVATGTTVNGTIRLSWQGSPGVYYATLSVPGYPSQAGTVTLGCNGSIIFKLILPNQQECCDKCSVPPLTLTDKNGSYPMSFADGSWTTGFVEVPGVPTVEVLTGNLCDDLCQTVAPNDSGTAYVLYGATCNGDGTYTVTRTWWWLDYFENALCVVPLGMVSTNYYAVCAGHTIGCGGTFVGTRCVDVNTGIADNPSGSTTCGNPGRAVGTLGFTCNPFSMEGGLTQTSDGLPDPVGGTVVIEPTS